MRKLFYPTALALLSFVPGAYAQAIAPIRMAPAALVVQMPEPSSPVLLVIDLLVVGALIFLMRRRVSGTNW